MKRTVLTVLGAFFLLLALSTALHGRGTAILYLFAAAVLLWFGRRRRGR